MINAEIHAGDLVLIRKQSFAENGQIIAARVNSNEATLKRYKQSGDAVVLLPENPAYDLQIVPARDFISGDAQIIGVALQVTHTLLIRGMQKWKRIDHVYDAAKFRLMDGTARADIARNAQKPF